MGRPKKIDMENTKPNEEQNLLAEKKELEEKLRKIEQKEQEDVFMKNLPSVIVSHEEKITSIMNVLEKQNEALHRFKSVIEEIISKK